MHCASDLFVTVSFPPVGSIHVRSLAPCFCCRCASHAWLPCLAQGSKEVSDLVVNLGGIIDDAGHLLTHDIAKLGT